MTSPDRLATVLEDLAAVGFALSGGPLENPGPDEIAASILCEVKALVATAVVAPDMADVLPFVFPASR